MAEEPNNSEEKKIFVDQDWKAQAQEEKERLKKEADQAAASQKAQGGQAQGAQGSQRQIPEASFTNLLNGLAMQALLALGGMEDPRTKRRFVDLELAKYHIDTLEVIEHKTKGNLTDEEAKLLEQALADLRMSYVQITKNARQLTPEELKQMQEDMKNAPDNQGQNE